MFGLEDFFVRAMLGGVGVSLAAGPVGCFVIWRRMAYFGAALAHSALLGIAVGFLLGINLTLGVFAFCLLLAAALSLLEEQRLLPMETLLSVLAHVTLAAGLVAISFLEDLRVDLMGYLFGDVLAVTGDDLYAIYAMTIVTLGVLVALWRDLLSLTVSEELAAAEGVRVRRVRMLFVLVVAGVIAIGMQIVGMLLILSLLIIPAAAARRVSATPERMAGVATAIAVACVVLGLLASLRWDLPSGPLIVLVASGFFAASLALPHNQRHRQLVLTAQTRIGPGGG